MALQTSELSQNERNRIINDAFNNNLHGKKIYLLGSAEFGPTNEPVLIKTSIGLKHRFGTKGSLIDAFHAIKYTSKDNEVYLVKVTGNHSSTYLNVNIENGDIIQDGFIIAASESNEIFDDIRVNIDIDCISFDFPKELKLQSLTYYYDDYPTIDKLSNAINLDTKLKRSCLQAYYSTDPWISTKTAFFTCNLDTIYLKGGLCGLDYTKDLLYNNLNKTYEILESHDIDIIVPLDAFMDDIYPNDSENLETQYGRKYYQATKDYLHKDTNGKQLSFMNQLINFCLIQLNFGIVTTGILGYNSYHKYSSYYLSEADELLEMYKACFNYNISVCDNQYYSFLVSVVAGDIMYNHGTIIDNGYLAYAALCADTIYTTGTTNIPLSDNIELYQEFSEEVLSELADNGIVTFRHSPLYNKVVVYDGITASLATENMKLYCNVKMVQMCISYINKLFQYYIGKNMYTLIEQKIIDSDLDKILNILSSKSIITKYSFKIEPNYLQNEIKVYLNLQTCYMIKSIKICSIIKLSYTEPEEE